MSRPLASVVIPTRDRRAVLARTLEALSAQQRADALFDVVVAVNASSDDTLEFLRSATWPFKLRVVVLDRPGAAFARNEGVLASVAPLLIFLDDDVEPCPGFVRAHLDAHGTTSTVLDASNVVGIGYLRSPLQPESDRFAIALRGWWEAMFDRMREPGHRFSWMDLLSGNFSVSRKTFDAVGGFETALRCHEDYELGYRLVERGCELVFLEHAAGSHIDQTRIERACWRKREEGIADAWIAERHPALRTAMPMSRAATVRQRVSRWLAFSWPSAGDLGARAFLRVLPVLEHAGATMAWMRVLYAVFGYWYERGLADALGARARLKSLLEGAWQEPRLRPDAIVDLAGGIEEAMTFLDRDRPDGIDVVVGARPIARVAWVPGAEPLAGRHVLPLLTRFYHRPVVEGLLESGSLTLEELLSRGVAHATTGAAAAAPHARIR